MSNLVFCRKYQRDLPALSKAPFPGALGQRILETVSQQAWDEWQAHQTRLINEKQLAMTDPNNRKYLMAQMELFFDNQDFEQASGYRPES
jgi:Fe-S cluster biosynthesis and repair protein YggX